MAQEIAQKITQERIHEFTKELLGGDRYQKILLCLHENADADSLCSNIAMSEILVNYRKNVTILSGKNNSFPKEFNAFGDWMNFVLNSSVEDCDLSEYDCFIMLDSASEDRLHSMAEAMTLPKFVIDHHSGNSIQGAVDSLIDTTCSSTAEIIFEIADNLKAGGTHLFGGDFNLAVYMGIWSDTMGLKYNVSSRTFEILSKITKYEFSPQSCLSLYEKSWGNDDYAMIRIGMNNLYPMIVAKKRIGICIISQDDLRSNTYVSESTNTNALINLFEKSQDLDIVIIASEDLEQKNVWRIRTRSYISGFHAKYIAELLGGTGHDKSAGATVKDIPSKNILQYLKNICLRIN